MMICTQKSKPIPNILKAWNMICLDIWFSDDWLRSWGYTSHGWSFEATPVSAGLGSERLMFIIRILLLRPKLAMQMPTMAAQVHKSTSNKNDENVRIMPSHATTRFSANKIKVFLQFNSAAQKGLSAGAQRHTITQLYLSQEKAAC